MVKVLIVEDRTGVRDTLVRMVRAAGHVAVATHHAPQAMRLLEREPVDVLVTDIYMPETDGLELIRAVRRSANARPGIMAMSGRSDDIMPDGSGILEMARKLGADEILEKPFMAPSVSRAIARSSDRAARRDREAG